MAPDTSYPRTIPGTLAEKTAALTSSCASTRPRTLAGVIPHGLGLGAGTAGRGLCQGKRLNEWAPEFSQFYGPGALRPPNGGVKGSSHGNGRLGLGTSSNYRLNVANEGLEPPGPFSHQDALAA